MSAETETNAQPTTAEPDLSPAAFANADDGDTGAPALDPNPAEPEAEAAPEEQPEGEPQPEAEDDDPPPEFWSAEKKAHWAQLKAHPELRAAIREHYEEATRATSKKIEEAAVKAKAAEEKATEFEKQQAQSVAWWQQFGPILHKQLQGKWAGVDWATLARENPAEYVAKKAEHDAEQAQFTALAQRQQQEAQEVARRAKERHQAERAEHHAKLAAKYPAEFGTPEKAQARYNELSKFIVDMGVAPERVEQIYEAPVVEIVNMAYKFKQLQAKAKEVTNPKPSPQDAAKTPTRVAPGAARQSANPSSEAERQALQALRNGGKLTADQMAVAFR
ncbi:MAG TPA: hypothetical protein VEC14_13145 [Reyranellaceae bacterium]|nr:hypothetical protein [Reyranellaceae bacterium]